VKFFKNRIFGIVLLSLFTALLLILSYPGFNQGWLAWAALAPFTAALWRAKNLKQALLSGFTAGFFLYAGILYWLYPTMRAGGVTPAVSGFGLAFLSLIMSAEFLLMAAFGFYLKRAGRRVWPYIFAAGWALMEYGKVYLSLKAVWFPWFMLGYTQWEYTPLIQVVSLAGVYGLSAAVCFTGALAGSILASKASVLKKIPRFLPVPALFGLILYYGGHELKKADSAVAIKSLSVAMLQPSIDLYSKWDAAASGRIRAEMEGLTAAAGNAGLVIWPENALPCWIDEPECYAWLKTAAARPAGGSIVGSVSKGDGRYVSAFLLDEKGEIKASYNKRRLVPFGEYVPLRGLLGGYIKPVAALGEFLPGPAVQRLFTAGDFKIGAAICYESVFPDLFADEAMAGAEVFVNITNDGWYLDTAAPYQHFIVNIFRAVENRRSVVRAANNGISGVIDPWGRVLAKTTLNERTALIARAPVYPARAVFPLYGNRFILASTLIVAAFLTALILI
jgi:apolipoprotein N-acyltransferase